MVPIHCAELPIAHLLDREKTSGRDNRSKGIHERGVAMHKRLRGEAWLLQIAVAVAYCCAVSLFRQVSISHWLILSGLNFSVLMIARYRFWPALMVGEAASFAYVSYLCVDQLGLAWSVCNVLPTLLITAPIVFWARERGQLFAPSRGVNISTLLISALSMAAVVTLKTLGLVMISKLPPGYPLINYQTLASRLMVGNYLGILTIAPLAAIVYQEIKSSSWPAIREKISQSRLVVEAVFGLLPVLAFLVWVGLQASVDTQVRQIVQIAMFLPVVWLALRHGWYGAAIGGTAASVAILHAHAATLRRQYHSGRDPHRLRHLDDVAHGRAYRRP